MSFSLLAETCMREVSHFLRPAHLEKLAQIMEDPEASDNDRYVAMNFLKNAKIAAIGPITAETCRQQGLQVDVQAEEYTIAGLIKAIKESF